MERERILSSTVLLAEAASEKESGMIGRSRKERLLAHRTLMKEKASHANMHIHAYSCKYALK